MVAPKLEYPMDCVRSVAWATGKEWRAEKTCKRVVELSESHTTEMEGRVPEARAPDQRLDHLQLRFELES